MNTDLKAIVKWLLTSDPVKILTGEEFQKSSIKLKDQVRTYYRENYGSRVMRQDMGDIILSTSGIKATIAHKGSFKRETAVAFAAVPAIIKHGKVYNYQAHWKGREYDTYTIGAPIKIGPDDYIAEVVIKKSDDDRSYYLHKVEIKTKLHSAFKTGSDTGAPEGASRLIIAQLAGNVKDFGVPCQ